MFSIMACPLKSFFTFIDVYFLFLSFTVSDFSYSVLNITKSPFSKGFF